MAVATLRHGTRPIVLAKLGIGRPAPDVAQCRRVRIGDFEDTLDMLRAVGFRRVAFYEYGDRPGTDASAMPEKVPPDVIRGRAMRARREFRGRPVAVRWQMTLRARSGSAAANSRT